MRDDYSLISALARGEPTAVDQLLTLYQGPVYRFIYRRVAPARADAEEILQDTFVAALRSAARYRGDETVLAWLYGIARHKIADYYRRRGRQGMELGIETLDAVSESHSDGDLGDQMALREAVDLALDSIPTQYRDLLLKKYQQGWSVGEIAGESQESAKAVESRLTRARASLAKSFRQIWGGDYR